MSKPKRLTKLIHRMFIITCKYIKIKNVCRYICIKIMRVEEIEEIEEMSLMRVRQRSSGTTVLEKSIASTR